MLARSQNAGNTKFDTTNINKGEQLYEENEILKDDHRPVGKFCDTFGFIDVTPGLSGLIFLVYWMICKWSSAKGYDLSYMKTNTMTFHDSVDSGICISGFSDVKVLAVSF